MWTPDYVIFDCDGVLVDSEPISNLVLRDDLAQRGIDLPLEEIMSIFVGKTIDGVAALAVEMGAELPSDWIEVIGKADVAAQAARCPIMPGIEDVLDRLDRAGIGYAVASNGQPEKMRATLGRTGLLSRLEGLLFSATECASPKPAPEVYLKAAAAAGVDPARCAVIEDSASGAKAGQAAGMHVFGFAAATPPERLRPYCETLFTELSALPVLLGLQS